MAVARCLLGSDTHPSADEVLDQASRRRPAISRATVYTTLNLFATKGLLKTKVLREGTAVFDPNVRPHHHFIDTATGRIYDIPWDAVRVSGCGALEGFEVEDHQVVMRGRKRAAGRRGRAVKARHGASAKERGTQRPNTESGTPWRERGSGSRRPAGIHVGNNQN